MKKMLWMSSVFVAISTPVFAQESYRPAMAQPNVAGVSGSATTNSAAELNPWTIQIPENTSLNQGAYIAVPLDPPLTPIGGGISSDNGGMNSNGSRSLGIGR